MTSWFRPLAWHGESPARIADVSVDFKVSGSTPLFRGGVSYETPRYVVPRVTISPIIQTVKTSQQPNHKTTLSHMTESGVV